MIEGDAAQARAAPSLVDTPAGGVSSRRAPVEFGAIALKNSLVLLLSSNQ